MVHAWQVNETSLAIAISQAPRLAGKLNKLLQVYPDGTRFSETCEPVFIFSKTRRPHVEAVLRRPLKLVEQ